MANEQKQDTTRQQAFWIHVEHDHNIYTNNAYFFFLTGVWREWY